MFTRIRATLIALAILACDQSAHGQYYWSPQYSFGSFAGPGMSYSFGVTPSVASTYYQDPYQSLQITQTPLYSYGNYSTLGTSITTAATPNRALSVINSQGFSGWINQSYGAPMPAYYVPAPRAQQQRPIPAVLSPYRRY